MLVRGWFARTLSTSPPSLVRSCHGECCGHSSASRKGSGTLQMYQKAAWKAFMVTRSPSSQLLFTACLLHFEWIFGGHIMFPNFPCGWKKYSNPKRYGRIQVSSFISTWRLAYGQMASVLGATSSPPRHMIWWCEYFLCTLETSWISH